MLFGMGEFFFFGRTQSAQKNAGRNFAGVFVRLSSLYCEMAMAGLANDATMRTHRVHVIRLIEEPEPMPFFTQLSEIFRCVNQLASANRRVGIIYRQDAAHVAGQGRGQDRCGKQTA